MDLWQRFTRWYDLDQGVFEEDVPFYAGLAQRTGAPILELGCGTGRLVLALAKAGHRVTGLEHQPAMLARAAAKVQAAGAEVVRRVSLVQGDFRHLALEERFRLAILAVNTWTDLAGPEEQSQVLRAVHEHLVPGGLLVLDLFHPHPDALAPTGEGLVLEKTLTDPQSGSQALKFVARQVDYARQVLTATFIYDETDAGGSLTRTAVTFHLHYLHRPEAEQLLRSAGYAVEGVYGDYELGPYGDDADRLLVVARRPEAERHG
jgi:SAM-dependent methyltransferase